MRKITLLIIILLSFNIFSQDYSEYEDTNEVYRTYQLLSDKGWYIENILPGKENKYLDSLTQVIYNPLVNYEVLDSILSWRESKGYKEIKVDWVDVDKRILYNTTYDAMDISKEESDTIILCKYEDTNPDCECSKSIVTIILDDSLKYNIGKKEIVFNTLLLNKRIKKIDIIYYKVYKENREEEYLTVRIKNKFRLFAKPYEIIY